MTLEGLAGVDAVRADGGLVHIRPAVPDDLESLRALHARASDRSIYLRFFSPNRKLAERYVQILAQPAGYSHLALVACVNDDISGVAAFERLTDDSAEVALLISDEHQHEGIGTLLLEHLANAARRVGIRRFIADVLAENGPMMNVLHDLGLGMTARLESGTVIVEMNLDSTDELVTAVDDRERLADVASLYPILGPASVAVVGASKRPGSVGHEVLRNILAGRFRGTVYAVNPRHDAVMSVPCLPSVEMLPESPDLVIIAVPADQVLGVVRCCGKRGARAVLILTSGFGEVGGAGRARQDEVVWVAHRYGMRVIGPNCLGLLNTDPAIRLNATFASLPMDPGGLGLVSQSGALGIAVVAAAANCGLGLSQFVSIGNKADVSSNDLLLAWEEDDRTQVIALYLESFGNPRKFARIAHRVARRKPVVAIKSGRSSAGQRAGRSHTAAAAASDVVVDALFTQAGVVRVDTIAQMLDAARVLCDQQIPTGPRVAIVGNSGGPGILAADAAERAGLQVVSLTSETTQRLHSVLPSSASWQNPVDLGAAIGQEGIGDAIRLLLEAAEVDAVLAVFTDTAVSDAEAVMTRIAETADSEKPVVAARVGGAPCSIPVPGSDRRLPVFTFPEPAAAALAAAYRYSTIRDTPPQVATRPRQINRAGARTIIDRAIRAGSGWMSADDVSQLLTCYDVRVCPQRVVDNVDDAAPAAVTLGYPLAVKAAGGGTHKTDVGGVRLGVPDEAALRAAFRDVRTACPDTPAVLLQPMVSAGTEVIVGAVQHEHFGPAVMLGVGGVLADLVADRAFRLAPLAAVDALEMIDDLRLARLIDGYRGGPVVSRVALGDLVVRIAALADDLPEIAELDLNPVICRGEDLVVVDARIRIAPVRTRPDPVLRQLNGELAAPQDGAR